MINLGMDFGSTNTTVSRYREDLKVPEALCMHNVTPYIPSIVAYDHKKNKFEFGNSARTQSGKPNISIFKAFKMLLVEKDKQVLEKRGYTEELTPQKISELFIGFILKEVLQELSEKRIGKIVIGVPEIWNETIGTADGKSLIKETISKIDLIDKIQIVSEPAAASAFFAYNFKKKTGKDFQGNILLVDYGGGTLDITLTNVTFNGTMQIKALERTGAGENENGEVGKAGVLYMETVMRRALLEEKLLKEEENLNENPKKLNNFYKAVYELETEIQSRTHTLKEMFREYEPLGLHDSIEELRGEEFTSIAFIGVYVEISYGLLIEVYEELIEKELDQCLNTMIAYMEQSGIDYKDSNLDNFKIVLVGGFGNYYLVEEQFKRKFEFSTLDRRQENIINAAADREQAISLGTALLANNIVEIKDTAPYSIGVWSYDVHKKVCYNYAIRYRQEIEYDKIYFVRGSLDNKITYILNIKGGFDRFLINFGREDIRGIPGLLKRKYAAQLENVMGTENPMAAIGFSLNQLGIITIHIFECDIYKDKIGKELRRVSLSKFSDMFEVMNLNV